ncbi:MAG: hypothetical protein K6G26_01610 [Lachnospiraceae bacterium]|nr:hypothetical protein [Lachnospiraceae bacterium]
MIIRIVLCLMGVAIYILSFIMGDPEEEKEKIVDEEVNNYVDHVMKSLQERLNQMLNEKMETVSDATDTRLAHMSNAKISEFEAYSQEVRNKIDVEHKEIMFLYDMLNNKDGDVKSTLGKIEDYKYQVDVLIEELNDKLERISQQIRLSDESQIEVGKQAAMLEEIADDIYDDNEGYTEEEIEEIKGDIQKYESENDEIIMKYNNGLSLTEISKSMGIGVGEVLLVVNLYKQMNVAAGK